MRQLGRLLVVLVLFTSVAAFGQSQLTITNSPPSGNVSVPYSFQFMGSGGVPPYTWGSSSDFPLPPGLTFSSSGLLSGTPTTVGTYNLYIFLQDSSDSDSGFVTQQFSITISPCAPSIVNTSPLPTAEVGINYSQTFQVAGCSGNQYTFFIAPFSVPPGLSLDSGGQLSGQPSKAGTYSFSVAVYDQTGTLVQSGTFSLTVAAPPSITTMSPLTPGIVGQPYGPILIAVTGGAPPYRYAIQGTLPPDLTFLSNGDLETRQGVVLTSADVGTFTFTITATDSAGVSAQPVTFQITIASVNPQLQVSPTSLIFSGLVGGDAPPPQAISITPASGASASPSFTVQVDSGQSGTPAPSWLTVTPTKGTAPASLLVTADQGSLQASSNVGRIRILDSNNVETDVSVTLNVTSGTSQLQVAPSVLRFTARQQTPGTLQQNLLITSAGGGGPVAFSSSIENGSSWITGITPLSGQTTRNTPTAVQVQINTQGLSAGNYHDMIQISSPAGNVTVPISLFVSGGSGPIMSTNLTGVRFQARQSGGFSNAQTVKILNLGDPSSTVNWTASVTTFGSNWLSLGSTSGTATTTTPGLLTLTPNSTATTLSAPAYALVTISDPHSQNSPQYVVAVLDLESSSTPPLPDPSPAGLFFSAVAGGSQPATQQVNVNTSSSSAVAFQTATYTTDGGNWLAVTPASGTSTGTSPASLKVSVTTTGLTAGIYTGLVNISMSGVLRSVNVTFVVEPSGATGSSGIETARIAGCTPSKLALTENGLANNFSVPAGWPATLIAQLNDDCGSSVTSGSVVASFSNGDAPLTLRGDGLGNYSATWQPGTVTPQMVINLNASSGSLTPATAKLVGGITQNQAPVLAPGGTLNNLNPVVGAPLAPGTVAQVYGSNLASGTTTPSTIPLPSTYPPTNSTQMLVGGLSAPLYYLSSGQLNVQLPAELTPNQQYQAVVISNNALTMPDTLDFVPQTPGVAATSDGHAIAQHNANYQLVTSANAAVPGEYVIVYLVGMGATNPPVASGAAAPSSPLAYATVQPTVTVGGQNAPIAFAGLTPGAVGLYQITFQVPSGLSAGDQTLVVTQAGVTANTTKLTIGE